MPWTRNRIGNVRGADGVVHPLYEHLKDHRAYWTTQCRIQWGSSMNSNKSLKPHVSRKRVTCVVCITHQFQVGQQL